MHLHKKSVPSGLSWKSGMRTIFIPQGCILTLVRGRRSLFKIIPPSHHYSLILFLSCSSYCPAAKVQRKEKRGVDKNIDMLVESPSKIFWVHRKWSLPSRSKCFVAWRDSGRRDKFSFLKLYSRPLKVFVTLWRLTWCFPRSFSNRRRNETHHYTEWNNRFLWVKKMLESFGIITQRNKKYSKDLVVLSQKWYV